MLNNRVPSRLVTFKDRTLKRSKSCGIEQRRAELHYHFFHPDAIKDKGYTNNCISFELMSQKRFYQIIYIGLSLPAILREFVFMRARIWRLNLIESDLSRRAGRKMAYIRPGFFQAQPQ